jgi:hypothetical protein
MSEPLATTLSRASAATTRNMETLVTICLFSGVGLLLSLSMLILDQYVPTELF